MAQRLQLEGAMQGHRHREDAWDDENTGVFRAPAPPQQQVTAHHRAPQQPPAHHAPPAYAPPPPRHEARLPQPPQPRAPVAPAAPFHARADGSQPQIDASPAAMATPADTVAVLSLVRRIALQADLATTLRVLQNGVAELIGATRVSCLTADPDTAQPWAAIEDARSLAGLSVVHRQQICAQPVSRCPIYHPDVDDPSGTGSESVIAQPIIASGATVAVLMCVRTNREPLYTQREGIVLAMIAAQCAPLIMSAVHAAMARQQQAPEGSSLFRDQALERHRSSRRDGALLNLSPAWVSRVFPVLLIVVALALAYAIFARVDQYSNGPAVIRIEGAEVTARVGGTVAEVYVSSRETVKQGQLLLRLHSDAEDAQLVEIDTEYDRQLATFLFDPSNESAKSSLASIAARKQKADMALDTRSIRAPRDGVVLDLRVRPGDTLDPGSRIATVASDEAMPTVVAFLPGHDRPRLKVGQTLQLKLPAFEKTSLKVKITSVGQEVIGPNEARRYAGEDIGDAMAIKGPVVIVRARLNSRTFNARGKTYSFSQGMNVKSEVVVRSRRVLVALVPALEKFLW